MNEFQTELLDEGLQALMKIREPLVEITGEGKGEPTNQFVGMMALGAIGEIFELIQEVGWKYWKKNPEPTDERIDDIAEEFADVLVFLASLMLVLELRFGITTSDIATAYTRKMEKNVARFKGESGEEGYVGLRNI